MKLSLNKLKKLKVINTLNSIQPCYILEDEKLEKKYVVQRKGKCQPDKCKSACCKFCTVNADPGDYWYNFGTQKKGYNKFDYTCKKLDFKNNKCKVWDTDNFPNACKQFPHFGDVTYWEVAKVCTFWFEIIYEVK